MKLTGNVIQSFKVAKAFLENSDRINSIDFSENGETLISSSDDQSIIIYDSEQGTQRSIIHSKKYGVDLVCYTHAPDTAIHSSTKLDDNVRHLSLPDNKYIRYYQGHTKKVTALSMSPIDDTFISFSNDKTLRLWDLRSPHCQGLLHLNVTNAAVNYDPEGLIFAAAYNSSVVKLYDLKSFDKSPFSTFQLPEDKGCDWTGLKFSPDGKTILISTNGEVIHLIDAFEGTELQKLTGYPNSKKIPIEASFSPDSKFVFSGSDDGHVHVWSAETGVKTAKLTCTKFEAEPIHCVKFNPKFMFLASASTYTAFWTPEVQVQEEENV